MRTLSIASAVILVIVLTGCGGGGPERAPTGAAATPSPAPAPAPAFGLTTRESVAALAIPLDGGAIGSYELEAAFPNLFFPAAVYLTAVPGENRLVVVQQGGFVRAFANTSTAGVSSLVLDLSGRLSFGGEEGLLGLAFDPAFTLNRFIYVHYSLGSPRRSRIARFTWDPGPDAVALSSEKVILEISQPYSNHNGGMLAFGPDDFLYIGMGDGGSGGDPQNHAQNPGDLLGSMLRIDVHPANPADSYDIPRDNPFVGQAGVRPETYAFGLRNPFRFSFDRSDGTLWLGDVGQSAREEIDIIEPGRNYGWRVFEGNLPYDDSQNSLPVSAFTAPVIDYGRAAGATVIGGYVYRGNRVPSLQGRYLYGDWVSGNIWALSYDAASATVLANDLIANPGPGTTSFGEDATGDVHLVNDGSLYRFRELTAGGPAEPPALLSQTGIFQFLPDLIPASGFIEYQLNQPFWSDGAEKRRWIAVPDTETIEFSAREAWQFPLGTVIVKHFELALVEGDPNSQRRLETRLLVHRSDGWRGFTYRWNPAETDAALLVGRETESIRVTLAGGGFRDQLYEYPSRTDCHGCHTAAAGFVLGARTLQLNGEFAYPAATDNQLRSWNHIGQFSSDIGVSTGYEAYPSLADGAVALGVRARSYLDVNCAQCHQPGGPAPTALDLRFDTTLAMSGVLDTPPGAGSLGVADARIVAPGDRDRSVLWLRMAALDGNRMPPIGSHVVDQVALEVIGTWIDSL